jgi:hypothetical protein
MQFEVGPREVLGVADPRCALTLVEQNAEVTHATFGLPFASRRSGGLHRKRGPQRLKLSARSMPMSRSQEACGRWSPRYEDAHAVPDLDQTDVGEGGQSLAHNRKAHSEFQGERPR